MGHTHLGRIPKSQKWSIVMATAMGIGPQSSSAPLPISDIVALSAQTLDAAKIGLDKAIDDAGLRYTFFLLTQLALAARDEDWRNRLNRVGFELPQDATLFDLTANLQNSIDDFVREHGASTDIGEMAQQAAGEALAEFLLNQTGSLFDNQEEALRLSVRQLSTKSGFSQLGQRFFGHFMTRFLNFYLSRVTADQMGTEGFQQIGDLTSFNDVLQLHCHQSARIVYDFCGEWYSKTEWQTGINLDNTSGFMAVAVKKLQRELEEQKVGND